MHGFQMAARFAARFVNRNPRNMEMMGKQRQPTGYQFETDRELRNFVYKLVFSSFCYIFDL